MDTGDSAANIAMSFELHESNFAHLQGTSRSYLIPLRKVSLESSRLASSNT